jgi:DNA-binding transcriptional LysR family regulator
MSRHQQIAIFEAVAREGSFAAAARHLGLSKITVVRSTAALERRLGVILLQRDTRGVATTDIGAIYAAECARLLREIEHAEASASGLHTEPRSRLKLTMPRLFGDQLLMPVLLDYLDACPGVEMSIGYQNNFPNLYEEGVDVAVMIGAPPDSSMVARKVGSVRPVLCASPGYLKRQGEPQTPQDMIAHSTVVGSPEAGALEWRYSHAPTAKSQVLKCTTQQEAIEAALANVGITRCLNYQVHHYVRAGQLRELLPAFAPPAIPAYLVYREGRKATARVRSFVDYAVGRLREHPALEGNESLSPRPQRL